MSVLLLSPDCVYERETALVQRSSSLVPPSTPHLHGQRREVALMGLGGGGATAFLMAAVFSQTVAKLVLKRRPCGLGLTCKHRQHQSVCKVLEPQRRPQVLQHKQRETKRLRSRLSPRPLSQYSATSCYEAV